jgi:hypothetical protein
VTRDGSFARTDVKMKGRIAAVQIGGQVSLFEQASGDYLPASSATPIRHPGGVAISAGRVLIGGDNCNYDGVVYEKGTDGLWAITGRLDDNTGDCDNYGLHVELNYNYALLRTQCGSVGTAWRRTGPAVDWVPAGTLPAPPGVGSSDQPFALQGATAVANSGYAYLRTGASTWVLQDRATSADNDNSFGVTFEAVYRDGVLLTSESGAVYSFPRVYLETSPGNFEHVASLMTRLHATELDLSGRTAVSLIRDSTATTWDVEIFTLPEQLLTPSPIVNDFEDRNASDFEVRSGQFQLATRGTNDVFTQSNSVGFAVALATESDWTDYQRVEADITAPTYAGSDSWVGLVARYVDTRNYYFAVIRANGVFGVYRRVNGVNTLLREAQANTPSPRRATFVVDGSQISLFVDNDSLMTTDSSLPRGRAGLATWRARADFDNVHIASAIPYFLFFREWGPLGSEFEPVLTTLGGDWQVPVDEEGNTTGLMQVDLSGDARAYIGTPVANQDVYAQVRLDRFAASGQAWFGLLARYVDPPNHYYVTVRNTNQIQIRKKVGGVITVLASVGFTPVPGETFDLHLRVIDDQLQVFVNSELVASAHAGDIASGQYGLATYRTAVTWNNMFAGQP